MVSQSNRKELRLNLFRKSGIRNDYDIGLRLQKAGFDLKKKITRFYDSDRKEIVFRQESSEGES
jgi:hypothetical protein